MLIGNHRKWWGRSGIFLSAFSHPHFRIFSTQKKRKIRNEGKNPNYIWMHSLSLGRHSKHHIEDKATLFDSSHGMSITFFFDECHVGCPRISDFRPLAMSFNKMGDFVFPSRHMGSMFGASRAQRQNFGRRQKISHLSERQVACCPKAPCREYLPTFPLECAHFSPDVGK